VAKSLRERANERDIVFGESWLKVAAEFASRYERVAVITSPRREQWSSDLGAEASGTSVIPIALARQHVPAEIVTEGCEIISANGGVDALIAIGGGSAIGLGKALRRELGGDPPFAAVATTYSGSEMTDLYGLLREGKKEVGKDPRCRPELVIYDPEMVAGLPLEVAVPSLFNAMAHAVDALYAKPEGELADLATRAIRELAGVATELAREPDSADARGRGLLGAYRAAAVLGQSTMALQHKLAHIVAGHLDLNHALTHAALLPHCIAYNDGAEPSADQRLRDALDGDPASRVFDLALAAGAAMTLGSHGLERQSIAGLAEAAAGPGISNPRAIEAELIASLLEDARLGRRPHGERVLDSPMAGTGPHGGLRPLLSGAALGVAKAAVVLVHGRGSTAERITELFEPVLTRDDVALVAIQADGRSWYPHAFTRPTGDNQPWLDSALETVKTAIARLEALGLARDRIALFGFSQGACLVLDLLARSGAGLAGGVAIAGGLIGDDAPGARHNADLHGLRVVTGIASQDPWLTTEEVDTARQQLRSLGAQVLAFDHEGSDHRITNEQSAAAAELISAWK